MIKCAVPTKTRRLGRASLFIQYQTAMDGSVSPKTVAVRPPAEKQLCLPLPYSKDTQICGCVTYSKSGSQPGRLQMLLKGSAAL